MSTSETHVSKTLASSLSNLDVMASITADLGKDISVSQISGGKGHIRSQLIRGKAGKLRWGLTLVRLVS